MNSSGDEDRLLALDPGSHKCGVAVLEPQRVVFQTITDAEGLRDRLAAWARAFCVRRVVVGGGTHVATAVALVREALPETPLFVCDERNTTREARALYFAAHPPRGWRRWIPLGLQVPPEPVDDFAAVALGQRFLAGGNAIR